MNALTENIKTGLNTLIAENAQLINTIKFALEGLNEMTTEEFRLGRDKEIRNRLETALELHKIYNEPYKKQE